MAAAVTPTMPEASDERVNAPTAVTGSTPKWPRKRLDRATLPTPSGVATDVNASASWSSVVRAMGRGGITAPRSETALPT